MGINVVLYQPEIPTNTGNIARTCAATDTTLHLIRPLGFSTDDRMLKRAGLDYWKYVTIHYYDSLTQFFQTNEGYYYYITKYGKRYYSDADLSDRSASYYFIFGRETSGLPDDLLADVPDRCLRLPITSAVRALNLANTAAIMVYEALRQQGFSGLT